MLLLLSFAAFEAHAGPTGNRPVLAPVLQFMDTSPVLVTSVTNVPASGSATLSIVSNLAHMTQGIRYTNTSSAFIGLYEANSLRIVLAPGVLDLEAGVRLSQGSVISVRNMAAAAVSAGSVSIEFE